MNAFAAGIVAGVLGRLAVDLGRALARAEFERREAQAMAQGTAAGMAALLGRPVRVEAPQSL